MVRNTPALSHFSCSSHFNLYMAGFEKNSHIITISVDIVETRNRTILLDTYTPLKRRGPIWPLAQRFTTVLVVNFIPDSRDITLSERYRSRARSIQRYISECPLTPHPSSYRTLLFALILRAVSDSRDKDENI